METLRITIPASKATTYSVLIGENSLQAIPEIARQFDSVAILYDESVVGIADAIDSGLDAATKIAVKSGEKSKSLNEVERVASEMLAHGISRESLLINIGGGMLTDLGGFIASSYMRGIAHINIPTTLLGMVDAAVGGKTGVNLREAKNVIGHFHHPPPVVVHLKVLETLPENQFNEGLVEIIKIAAMLDARFFNKLESAVQKLESRENSMLRECIRRAIELKSELVEEDEKDSGKRLFLNFGHTVGHALEVLSGFRISHGKAVSMGMACEMKLAGIEDMERVIALLERIEMPTVLPKRFSSADLLNVMRRDKKSTRYSIHFAAPRRIGVGAMFTLDSDSFARQFS